MNRKLIYTDPSTGLKTDSNNIPDPKIEFRYTGTGVGLALPEEAFYVTNDSTYPFEFMLQGIERNRIDGGPFVPHGALQGREAITSGAITATDTTFSVLDLTMPDGTAIFETDFYYIIADRRPKPEEIYDVHNNSDLNAEVFQLGTYSGSNPISLNGATQFANNHPKYSVIQPVTMYPASYNLDTGNFGYRYQLEQPTAVTGVSGVDGGSQKIDVSWTQSSEEGEGVLGYMIQILKKGDTLSLYGPPVMVPEYVLPSQISSTDAIYNLASGSLSLASTTYTVEGLDVYFKTSDRTQASIVAGDYYAIVRAINSTTLGEDFRMSDPTSSAAITVA